MKRFVSSALLVCLLLLSIPITAYGAESDQEIIYLNDGCYLTVVTTVSPTRAGGTNKGEKTYSGYFHGDLAWEITLKGSFSFTGSSAVCTSASCDVSIYDNTWYTVSKNASRSGNTAKASVTMGERMGSTTLNKYPVTLMLSCSADGELS